MTIPLFENFPRLSHNNIDPSDHLDRSDIDQVRSMDQRNLAIYQSSAGANNQTGTVYLQ